MALFEKGQRKIGGRKKGSPNKSTQELLLKAETLGIDPFDVILMYAKRDWKGLGYSAPNETRVLKDGGTIDVPTISAEMQLKAASEAAQYLYPKRKAIEHSTDESQGFIVKIEDYGVKK